RAALATDGHDAVLENSASIELEPAERRDRLTPPLRGRAGVEQALPAHAHRVDGVVAVTEHDHPGVGEAPVHACLTALAGAGVVHHRDRDAAQGLLENGW